MSDEIVITRNNSNIQQSTSTTTFATEVVDLPSKGKFYPPDNPLSSGRVELKYMTAKEEDILSSPNLLKKGIAVDKLLESLIVNKNISLNSMLLGDKNALIFASRRLAYGDAYGPLEIECPKCNVKNNITIDLGILGEKEIEEVEVENNEFKYTLPVSKAQITFRLLTASDEIAIERENQTLTKIKKDVSGEVTTRLKHIITSVNGDREKKTIVNFVDNMLSKDSLALRQYVKSVEPDINKTFSIKCESCASEEKVVVPITAQFFWPDTRI